MEVDQAGLADDVRAGPLVGRDGCALEVLAVSSTTRNRRKAGVRYLRNLPTLDVNPSELRMAWMHTQERCCIERVVDRFDQIAATAAQRLESGVEAS